MSKFRKKPVVIEARKFATNNEPGPGSPNMDGLVAWINEGKTGLDHLAWHNGTTIFVPTLEGVMRAECGDWIIKGVQGEFYPIKAEIFAETYEAVE